MIIYIFQTCTDTVYPMYLSLCATRWYSGLLEVSIDTITYFTRLSNLQKALTYQYELICLYAKSLNKLTWIASYKHLSWSNIDVAIHGNVNYRNCNRHVPEETYTGSNSFCASIRTILCCASASLRTILNCNYFTLSFCVICYLST